MSGSNSRLARLCTRITDPAAHHPFFFAAALLLPLLPDAVLYARHAAQFVAARNLLYSLLLALFRAYVLTLPLVPGGGGNSLLRRLVRGYETAVLLLLGTLGLVETFLLLEFDLPYSYTVLILLWETNVRESLEFLSSYAGSPTFIAVALATLLLPLGALRLRRCRPHFRSGRRTRIALTLLLLAGAGLFASRIAAQYRIAHTEDIVVDMQRSTATLSLFERLHVACFWFRDNFSAEQAERMMRANEQAAVDSCTFRSPCIVLVIGESFNKYHSELYGYPLPTNPLLRQRLERGELLLFRDAVSPANVTNRVLTALFSTGDPAGPETPPLFPALFKKAGYATRLFDNQFSKSQCDYFDLGLKAMFNAHSNAALFTTVNERCYPYDMQLLEECDRLPQHDAEPELVIFHLMGQHMGYISRFPEQYAYFGSDDIPRNDLSRAQRQTVADYDNATRYNDAVVDAIIRRYDRRDAIVIYLADHGEEIYDYRDFRGRSHGVPTPGICRCQYEIPMMIWMSESYRRNRPELAERIAGAVGRPFLSSDTAHLLFDLAGIRCRWFDPTRSIIGDRCDTTRKRLISSERLDYEALRRPHDS